MAAGQPGLTHEELLDSSMGKRGGTASARGGLGEAGRKGRVDGRRGGAAEERGGSRPQ